MATNGSHAISKATSATEGHVTSHATQAYSQGTSAATETPSSDELQESSSVGTTPMPATFAGK